MSKILRSGRLDWVDYAKGIGIILVVYGHVLIGIYNSKIDIPHSFYDYCQKFIYSFHMPLFFFLAGLFYEQKELTTFKNFLFKKELGWIFFHKFLTKFLNISLTRKSSKTH